MKMKHEEVLRYILSWILIADILCVSSVKINRLIVPDVVKQGNSAILDCDYSVDGQKDDGLVLKWFFNDNPYPIYQWIPYAKPQELGILKGRLNLNFIASTNNFSQHRALLIDRVGVELSGNFTCLVSTFTDEDKRTKEMLVFAPGREMDLKVFYAQDENERHRIVCDVDEVYPKPTLNMFINGSELENVSSTLIERQEGFFDVEMTTEVSDLPDGTQFTCELRIPQANYTVKKEVVHYKLDTFPRGSGLFVSKSVQWLLVLPLSLFILHIKLLITS